VAISTQHQTIIGCVSSTRVTTDLPLFPKERLSTQLTPLRVNLLKQLYKQWISFNAIRNTLLPSWRSTTSTPSLLLGSGVYGCRSRLRHLAPGSVLVGFATAVKVMIPQPELMP